MALLSSRYPKNQKSSSSISGVIIQPLKRIPDERGTVMHGARVDTLLNPFGEVYFKKLNPGIINGWHLHDSLILNYICLQGMMKLVLYDMRKKSPTYRKLQEIFFGDDNYCLVHIPPGIANACKAITPLGSLFCNIASHPHDPRKKYLRIDPHSKKIPYDWDKKDY